MTTVNKRIFTAAATIVAIGMVASAPARANTIVHSGGSFSVVASVVDANTADFLYTADFDNPGWTGPGNFIFAIDFKLEGYTVDNIDSFSTTAPGNWITKGGPTNGNGCQDVNDTFACAEDDPFSEATGAATSGSYTWNFRVTFTTDVDPADFLNATNHIGAFFNACDYTQNPNDGDARVCSGTNGLSEYATFGDDDDGDDFDVPEPGSLALLGLGLIGLGMGRRRRVS